MKKYIIITFLICTHAAAQGADYSAQLFHAVKTNNKTAAKKLLRRNGSADINALNEDGKTVLDVAVESNNKRMVKFLVNTTDAKVAIEKNAHEACFLLLNPHRKCWILAAIFTPIITLILYAGLLCLNPYALYGYPIVAGIMLGELIGCSITTAHTKHDYLPRDFMLEPAQRPTGAAVK